MKTPTAEMETGDLAMLKLKPPATGKSYINWTVNCQLSVAIGNHSNAKEWESSLSFIL